MPILIFPTGNIANDFHSTIFLKISNNCLKSVTLKTKFPPSHRAILALSRRPSCPKLGGYWRFYTCQYHKGSNTCSELDHIDACPLPRHPGTAGTRCVSLFLFMRDVADDDFVGWIDRQLGAVDSQSPDRLGALREAIIGPLRNVYGVADKVLAMAMSYLLLSAGKRRPLWLEVGAT